MDNKVNYKIHSTADVSDSANVGKGTSIWHQVQVREGARIGNNCILGKGVYVDFKVTIGDNCKLQNGAQVYHPATLEDGVFLGPGVIVTNDKLPRAVNPDMSLKSAEDWLAEPVWIGMGAAVGAGSILLPGIRIGRWAMVGAGSVVTKNIPAQGLALGQPARLVGHVCLCGARLRPIKRDGLACSRCHREYTLEENNIDPNF